MSAAAPPRPRTAAVVAEPLPLSDAARALLAPDVAVRPYLDALVAADLTPDALRVLAAALPKPEAVWWAHLCVGKTFPAPRAAAHQVALDSAEAWVKGGTDDQRRACGSAADAAGWDTAAGCVAAAAWLSGGSLAPSKLPPAPPADGLTAQTVVGALLLAAAVDPKTTEAALKQFLQLGLKVAVGEIRKGEPAG